MNKHHLLTGRKLDPYTITVLRDQIDAATTAAYQPGPDADPGMPPASPFVRPSEWAEFSEPNARPDSQA